MHGEIQEIGKEFYLLRSDEKDFHRNIYIKRFVGPNGDSLNMIMDPGTPLDYPSLSKALKELIGGVKNIHIVFLSHQDPDVSSNIGAILASAPKALVFTSIDTWRLVKMYGIPEKRFKPIESFKKDLLKVKRTGHWIQFVPARYCHFRGAMMIYDHESRILFSGDFMAGVNTRKGPGIYANEESWEGISLFHQIYMPSKRAIQMTVDRINMLNPTPKVIAPQHGDIVKGQLLEDFLQRLASLDVGLDTEENIEAEKENLYVALSSFLEMLKLTYPDVHSSLMELLTSAGEFTTAFKIVGGSVMEIKLLPKTAINHFWKALKKASSPDLHEELGGLFANSLKSFGIEPPEETLPEGPEEEDTKDLTSELVDLDKLFG